MLVLVLSRIFSMFRKAADMIESREVKSPYDQTASLYVAPSDRDMVRGSHSPACARSSPHPKHSLSVAAAAVAAAAVSAATPGVSTGPRGRRGCSPAAAAENGDL